MVGGLVALSFSSVANAANKKAQEFVAGAERQQAELLLQFPPLAKIDLVIRNDCAAKNPGHIASDTFCKCAAAVTTGLWRSGADPNMVPRLQDFLNDPKDEKAAVFAKYQGPELYKGVCESGSP